MSRWENEQRSCSTGRSPTLCRSFSLAKLLFKLLDQPKDQVQNAARWKAQASSLLTNRCTEAEIASVMEFAVRDNDYSAQYLTIANEPMASFVKNYDNLY